MGVNVLISGAEVRDARRGNRGAEQLLRSSAARLRSMGYQPAVTIARVDSDLRRDAGLRQYVGNPRLERMDALIPSIDFMGFSTLRSFRGVLDASGYALGDPWGAHTATWIMRKYSQWKSQGLKIIALPQAYGPFVDPTVREQSKRALELCDLIFAREEESYGHLIELGVDASRCRVCPDITIAEGVEHHVGDRSRRLVIVPNWNLAERADSSSYLNSLVGAVDWGNDRGYSVVGLLHEGSKDLAILSELADRAPIEIIDDLSGWETKSYIGASSLVVSGRYHAVVAALSTETPVITHSWSHKYGQLLRQFGVEGWLRDPSDVAATITGLEELERANISVLRESKRALSQQVEAMWSEVADVLSR